MSELAIVQEETVSEWMATEPRDKWQEYEAKKRHIAEWSRSRREYERRIAELKEELGI